MRKLAPFILLASLLVAGCWQTNSRPFRNVTSLQPFEAGPITETGPDRRVTHYALRKIERGRYRMTQTDRGQDFGQGFELGFFPLPGAPSHVLIYQAASLEHTAGEDRLRYYGLLIVTGPKSAEEIRPDCEKDARRARIQYADGQGWRLHFCRPRGSGEIAACVMEERQESGIQLHDGVAPAFEGNCGQNHKVVMARECGPSR